MKLIGIVFILVSAVSLSVRIAVELKKRCAYLRQFLNALNRFENEISFSATPLPEAFGVMAETMTGRGKRLLESVSTQMRKKRWTMPRTAMERALEEEPDDLIADILLELSGSLGKYDIHAQLTGISQAKARTEQLLLSLEEERGVKSKTYETLCICAGLATTILLI